MVGYAFVIPISRAGIVLFSALVFITWLFSPSIKDDLKYLIKNKLTLLLGIFVGYTLIALLWSSNLDDGVHYAKRYWYYLPMLVIATNLKKENLNHVISAFLLSMLISEILSYGMYFDLVDIKNGATPFPVPFMHHIQYSVFIVFTSIFLLNKIFYLDVWKHKILYSLFFMTVTMNIFINGGRTGYIAFFITLSVVAFLSIQNRLKAAMIALIIMLSTLFVSYNYSTTFQQRLHDSSDEITAINKQDFTTSVGQRIALYKIGEDIISHHFFFGVGTGAEMDALKKDVDTNFPQFSIVKDISHFHNVFLHTMVQLGLVGVLLQIMIFYYLFKIEIKNRYYNNIKYAFATIYLLACFSGNMFHQQFTMALFSLIVGILLAISKMEKLAK